MSTPAPRPGIRPGPPAARLLGAVLDVYREAGVKPPDRQYLAPGPLAAWDGAHLAVSLTSTLPGSSDTSQRPGGLNARHVGAVQMPRGAYEVRILRCIPTVDDNGNPPTADELTEATEELLVDAGLLLDGVYRFCAESPNGSPATPGQLTPLGPEGALAGYTAHVTISPMR